MIMGLFVLLPKGILSLNVLKADLEMGCDVWRIGFSDRDRACVCIVFWEMVGIP